MSYNNILIINFVEIYELNILIDIFSLPVESRIVSFHLSTRFLQHQHVFSTQKDKRNKVCIQTCSFNYDAIAVTRGYDTKKNTASYYFRWVEIPAGSPNRCNNHELYTSWMYTYIYLYTTYICMCVKVFLTHNHSRHININEFCSQYWLFLSISSV